MIIVIIANKISNLGSQYIGKSISELTLLKDLRLLLE